MALPFTVIWTDRGHCPYATGILKPDKLTPSSSNCSRGPTALRTNLRYRWTTYG
jgi:hypothetical protein